MKQNFTQSKEKIRDQTNEISFSAYTCIWHNLDVETKKENSGNLINYLVFYLRFLPFNFKTITLVSNSIAPISLENFKLRILSLQENIQYF